MIANFIVFALSAQIPRMDRLRTLVPNGSAVIVEARPAASSLLVHLFASNRGIDDAGACGRRHLLEHLIVKGADGRLDRRLEANGAFLRARTLRDGMDVEISLPPDKLDLGLSALQEVLAKPSWSQADLAKEAGVIDQELAIENPEGRLTAAAWKLAYGKAGADPEGDPAVIHATTPDELVATWSTTFAASNLVLMIEGPVDVEKATKTGLNVIEKLPKAGDFAAGDRKAVGTADRTTIEGAFGEVRGVAAPSMLEARCAADLAAGLALASQIPGSFFVYTPSVQPGLVAIGNTNRIGALTQYVDGLDDDGADQLYARGRTLARRWLLTQLATPEGAARLRGYLAVQSLAATPEVFLNRIDTITPDAFRKAVASFKSDQAVTVVGSE